MLRVLAESVENAQQIAILKRQDCDGYQGFLYSAPLDAKQFSRSFLTTG